MKSDSFDTDPEVIDDSEVVEEEFDSEVVEEESDSEVVEEESDSEVVEEESNEISEHEEVTQDENVGVVIYDYTSSLSDIQNSLSVNNAMLLGVVLFLGVAMGLRKHD